MIQKLFFSYLLIEFLFCVTVNASNSKKTITEFPQTTIESRNIMNNNLFGEMIMSGALTSGPEYKGVFGIQGMLDYRFNDFFSVGLQGNIYFLESDITSYRQLSINLRTDYHLIKEKRFVSNDWDWYIGIDLGGDIEGGNKKITSLNKFAGVHTGLRYKLNNNWMVFAEVGSRNTALGLAISL